MSEEHSDSSVQTDSESEEGGNVSANSQPGDSYAECDDPYRSEQFQIWVNYRLSFLVISNSIPFFAFIT